MNMAHVKWYSTKRNVKSLDTLISKKNLLHKKYNQYIDESYIFIQQAEYLKSLFVNEDTQTTIENFLLNYSSILDKKYLEKRKNIPVNYNLISNRFTKQLKSKKIQLMII